MHSQAKFVGEYYEVTTTETTKHYSVGGQRVAVRENGTLTYLLGDHLGGTSAVVNPTGQKVAENWYLPFGDTRYSSGTLPTGYTYTGQFDNTADFGWMYYKARWYDPELGRFGQPDSVVPGAGDPRAWDRFSYVKNNPVGNSDPSGHRITCGDGEVGGCGGDTAESEYFRQRAEQLNCQGGYESSCSYAQNHPVETAAFLITGLVSAGGLGALIGPSEISVGTLTTVTTTTVAANTACGGDMCASELNQATDNFGNLSHAGEYGIENANTLKNALTNTGLQVHHIIEQRFAEVLGKTGAEVRQWLSVTVTPDEHQVFTNAWRNAIGYSNSTNPLTTYNVTPVDILQAAESIYSGYPILLDAARRTLGLP